MLRCKFIGFIAALVVTICSGSVSGEVLIVLTTSHLNDVLGQIAQKYEDKNPETTIIVKSEPSHYLLKKIANPNDEIDVLASVDSFVINEGLTKNLLLENSVTNFATDNLVIVVHNNFKTVIKDLRDLEKRAIKHIAIGNPKHVPSGTYAYAKLKELDFEDLDEDEDNYGRAEKESFFIYAYSTSEIYYSLIKREYEYGKVLAQAGFVLSRDLEQKPSDIKIAFTVPIIEDEENKNNAYQIAIVKDSSKQELAADFINFVLAQEGQEILVENHFATIK